MGVANGSPLSEFTTLMASQGPAWASGVEDFVNEAQLRAYTLSRITSHKNIVEYAQGGDQITDTIYFDVKSTTQRYNPGADVDRDNPQTGVSWTVDWSFLHAHMSWNKQEIGLNKDTTTKKYRAQRYKSVMFQKHQNLYTDVCNTIETEFWAVPSHSLMEAAATPGNAKQPYSFPVFCNEFANGLHSGMSNTVMNINPATQTKWQNSAKAYPFSSASALLGAGIFAPMSRLVRQMTFGPLPKYEQYGTKTRSPHVIFASDQGLANYEWALRTNQDEFRGMGAQSGQDPDYNGPTFRGIPMEYIETLDTAAIYPTGASDALGTELGTGKDTNTASIDGTTDIGFAGPRYYVANLEYVNWVTHSENYLVMEEPIKLQGQIGTFAQDVDLWNNTICRSRRKGFGLLFPDSVVVNA
jgi:hypothetical protein